MKCGHARKLFSPHCDGELSAARNRRVSSHVEHCAACRAELEDYKNFVSGLSRGLLGAGQAVTPARPASLQSLARPARSAKASRYLVPGAALAAGLLVVLFLWAFPGRRQGTVVPKADRSIEDHAPGFSEPQVDDCGWLTLHGGRGEEAALANMVVLPNLSRTSRLQEVALATRADCGNKVRLCYDSEEGPIMLEQEVGYPPEECQDRDVQAADFAGCLIEAEGQCCPELIWYAGQTKFSLTAQMPAARIIELAGFVDKAYQHQSY